LIILQVSLELSYITIISVFLSNKFNVKLNYESLKLKVFSKN